MIHIFKVAEFDERSIEMVEAMARDHARSMSDEQIDQHAVVWAILAKAVADEQMRRRASLLAHLEPAGQA